MSVLIKNTETNFHIYNISSGGKHSTSGSVRLRKSKSFGHPIKMLVYFLLG